MKDEALRVFSALYDASVFIDLDRLPELMCGFARKEGQGPTLYPVACSPQAWSAAAVLLLLEACLGLEVDAAARQVRFHAPRLPEWLDWIRIDGLAVAGGSVDLVVRGPHVEVLAARGGVGDTTSER
jgi:glycogen debranching enzyme